MEVASLSEVCNVCAHKDICVHKYTDGITWRKTAHGIEIHLLQQPHTRTSITVEGLARLIGEAMTGQCARWEDA